MQINLVQKKHHIIPYICLLMLAFCLTIRFSVSAKDVIVEYSSHTASVGWSKTSTTDSLPKDNTQKTTAKTLNDENIEGFNALKIQLSGKCKGGITYNIHTVEGSWLNWEKDGTALDAAKTNINSIKIKLYGEVSKSLNIKYRVLTNESIWSDWVSNGEDAGDSTSKSQIIDLEIAVEEKPSAISSFARFVKNVTTPDEVLDYDDPANIEVVDNSVPTSGTPDGKSTTANGLTLLNKAKKGIDVSYYNGNIDWKKVKAAGIDYAIIQVGYRGSSKGSLKDDKKFEYNIKSAIEAGLDVGVYFVTQAITSDEAKEEAEYVINKLSNYTIQYPVYIDIEEVKNSRAKKLNNAQRTTVCKVFCETIKAAGYQTGVYSCQYWFQSKLNTSELASYNIWCAAYGISSRPKTKFEYQMWQCSETGKVNGISGCVDVNYCYVDYVNAASSIVRPAPSADPAKALG